MVVTSDAQGQLIYEIDARGITNGDDRSVREQLLRVIKPISGEVSIVGYETVAGRGGTIQSYKVVVKRVQ